MLRKTDFAVGKLKLFPTTPYSQELQLEKN
jgi:hypothetical protein